ALRVVFRRPNQPAQCRRFRRAAEICARRKRRGVRPEGAVGAEAISVEGKTGAAFRPLPTKRHGQVENALTSCSGPYFVPSGFVYVFTAPVFVSVTRAVTSTSVRPAPKTQ